jgi:hypothetical protein
MADRLLKPDSGNDLILQNDDASAKIEINEAGTIIHTGTSSIDVSGGTFTSSTAQKQAIVQAGPGSGTFDVSSGTITLSDAQRQSIVQAGPGTGTIDVSSGTFTSSTAQKQAIVDGATIEAQDLASGSGTTLPNNVQDAITRLGTVTSGTFNGTIGDSATFPDFSIIQIRFDEYKAEAGSTSESYTSLAGATFEVQITPSSASNYILVTCTAEIEMASNDCHVCSDFYRDIGGTSVNFIMSSSDSGQGAGQTRAKEDGDRYVVTWLYLDSPNTTSLVKYRPSLRRQAGSGLYYIGSGAAGANTITAMEIT